MAAPIEFRYHLRRFTLEDLAAGVQPVRQIIAGKLELFAPPALQFRHRERTTVDGNPTLRWSDWADVLYVREGDDQTSRLE